MSVRLDERDRMSPRATDGIVRSGRRMLAILVSMARTRLNLLAVEITQEKNRIWLLLLLTALVLLFAFMALLTLSLFVIVAFWDDNRLLAISVSPEHHQGENWDLAILDPTRTTPLRRLTTGAGNDRLPDWKPR